MYSQRVKLFPTSFKFLALMQLIPCRLRHRPSMRNKSHSVSTRMPAYSSTERFRRKLAQTRPKTSKKICGQVILGLPKIGSYLHVRPLFHFMISCFAMVVLVPFGPYISSGLAIYQLATSSAFI